MCGNSTWNCSRFEKNKLLSKEKQLPLMACRAFFSNFAKAIGLNVQKPQLGIKLSSLSRNRQIERHRRTTAENAPLLYLYMSSTVHPVSHIDTARGDYFSSVRSMWVFGDTRGNGTRVIIKFRAFLCTDNKLVKSEFGGTCREVSSL